MAWRAWLPQRRPGRRVPSAATVNGLSTSRYPLVSDVSIVMGAPLGPPEHGNGLAFPCCWVPCRAPNTWELSLTAWFKASRRRRCAAPLARSVAGLSAGGARPARARRGGHLPQINPAHSDPASAGRGDRPRLPLSSSQAPRLGRLPASLRDGFASLDTAPRSQGTRRLRERRE
jgi:hypothetical protein